MADLSTNSTGLSPVLIALRTCFIVFLGLLIVAGNILSISVTRRVTNLADSTKVLMTTLAAYDLLVGLLSLLNSVASGLNQWPYGDIGCTIASYCENTILCMSMYSIICLNVDRYIAITKPYKFPVWCTKRRVIVLVVSLSVLSLLSSGANPLVFGVHAQYFPGPAMCFFDSNSNEVNIIGLLLIDTIPTLVMTGLYYPIIRISRQHELRENRNQNEGNNIAREHKALKTFLVVTLTFCACYTPFATLRIMEGFTGWTTPDWLGFLTVCLLYSNSAFNVFIYCLFNQAYRQTAKKIITERLPCLKRSTVGPVNI
ncbi:trace amine-associated receptor 8b-like [Patiria miniata]|uniref:G-protein coupled receptors family 1 profile domain-containing protein n=1 Tax=Patiria miniata TaxID=46514 RepID=A0A914BQD5_PATMI|nr:trace amine-associated receptor 8b-like [Patiria miniata]